SKTGGLLPPVFSTLPELASPAEAYSTVGSSGLSKIGSTLMSVLGLRGARLTAGLPAGPFLAAAFLATAFLATAFLATTFLATTFLATAFLATAFLATAFLATPFLATTYVATAFLATA